MAVFPQACAAQGRALVIAIDRGQHIDIYTPYRREFLDDLKRVVPWQGRSWLEEDRAWRISKQFEPDLMELLHEHFDHVEVINPTRQDPPRASQSRSHTPNECVAAVLRAYPDHATLWVIPGAPQLVFNAAYRALARDSHPDTGGSHDRMVQLNNAYDRVKAWQ